MIPVIKKPDGTYVSGEHDGRTMQQMEEGELYVCGEQIYLVEVKRGSISQESMVGARRYYRKEELELTKAGVVAFEAWEAKKRFESKEYPESKEQKMEEQCRHCELFETVDCLKPGEMEFLNSRLAQARGLLQQEQRTIRALEDDAVKHGYDMETGECLVDWVDKQLADLRRLTEGIFGIHDVDETLREVKRICKDRQQLRRDRQQLQNQVDHWKKKYDEKIFHNE